MWVDLTGDAELDDEVLRTRERGDFRRFSDADVTVSSDDDSGDAGALQVRVLALSFGGGGGGGGDDDDDALVQCRVAEPSALHDRGGQPAVYMSTALRGTRLSVQACRVARVVV